jgi:SdpI/YhfL family protein
VTVFEKGTITVLAVAAVFALTAIPLVLRKVPRNVVYGYRTRTTLADDRIWYAANAHFGRGMLIASVVSAVLIVILARVQALSPRAFLNDSIAVLVIPLLVATIATARYIRRIKA